MCTLSTELLADLIRSARRKRGRSRCCSCCCCRAWCPWINGRCSSLDRYRRWLCILRVRRRCCREGHRCSLGGFWVCAVRSDGGVPGVAHAPPNSGKPRARRTRFLSASSCIISSYNPGSDLLKHSQRSESAGADKPYKTSNFRTFVYQLRRDASRPKDRLCCPIGQPAGSVFPW